MPLRSDSSSAPNSPQPDTADATDTELEMRRALGLAGDGAAPQRAPQFGRPAERHAPDGQKRRFVQDGEVPVFVVQGRRNTGAHAAEPRQAINFSPVNRLEAAETALRQEREAHATAERHAAEAQASLRELQTALGHAVLARDEARNAAQQAQLEIQQAKAALTAAQHAQAQAEAARDDLADRLDEAEAKLREARLEIAAAASAALAPTAASAPAPEPTELAAAVAPRKRGRKPASAHAVLDLAPAPGSPTPVAPTPVAPAPRVAKTRAAKPAAAVEKEPQPVKWWIKPRAKKAR